MRALSRSRSLSRDSTVYVVYLFNCFSFIIFTLAQIVYKAITSVILAVCFCDMLLQRFSSLYKISAEMSLCLEKTTKALSLALKFGMFSRGRIGVLALSQVGMLNILRLCLCVCARKYHSLSSKNIMSCFLCVFSLSRVLALNCTVSHQMLQGFLYFLNLKATYTECYVFCIIINMF